MTIRFGVIVPSNYDLLGLDLEGVMKMIKKECGSTIKWAYVLHDKDKAFPHYHIYFDVGNDIMLYTEIRKFFPFSSHYVSHIYGNIESYFLYMIHYGKSDKHQYLPSDVVANFNFKGEIKRIISKYRG